MVSVAEAGLEFKPGWLELLPSPPENSGIVILQYTQFCEVLGMGLGALCMLAKRSTTEQRLSPQEI